MSDWHGHFCLAFQRVSVVLIQLLIPVSTILLKMPRELNVAHQKKLIVRSMKSKLPSQFSQFLSCGENKNRLIELLFEVTKNERKVLEMLRCDELVLLRECKLLTHIEEKTYDQLLSTQEEADTKIIAHAVEILHQDTENKVVIRSPSTLKSMLQLTMDLFNQGSASN